MKGKKIILTLGLLLLSVVGWSQSLNCDFNPIQFERELENYIEQTVRLSPSESAKFFPLYEEMRAK